MIVRDTFITYKRQSGNIVRPLTLGLDAKPKSQCAQYIAIRSHV